MENSPFKSIRAKLLLLVLISILPALGIILYSGLAIQKRDILRAEGDALRTVRFLAFEHEQIVERSRHLLVELARTSEVGKEDAAACNRLFRKLLLENPLYANIFAATADGTVFAGAKPFAPHNVRERKYFQDALRTMDFSAGEFVVGMTVKQPVLHFAFPVRDARGRFQGAVAVALDLNRYGRIFFLEGLPAGSSFLLSDHGNRILFRHPDPVRHTGKAAHPPLVSAVSSGGDEGTFLETGHDGGRYLYAYKKFHLTAGAAPYLFLRVGIPEEEALGAARRALLVNLLLLGIVLVAGIGGAWFLVGRLIVGRMKRLLDAVELLGQGDVQARAGLKPDQDELGLLAGAFDEMATALEKKEGQRRSTQEALRESENRFRKMFDDAPVGYHELDVEGRVVHVNSTELTMLGYASEEMVGRPVWEFIRERETSQKAVQEKLSGTMPPGRNYERTYVRKDGTEIRMLIQDRLLLDGEGRITGIRATLQDVTEHRQAEEALRQSRDTAERLAGEMAVIAEIGRIAGSTLDLGQVFERVAAETRKLIPFDRFLVNLKKTSDGQFVAAYVSGMDNPRRRVGDLYQSQGTATGVVMATRAGILIQPEDAEEIRDLYPNLYETFKVGLRSTLSVPLIAMDDVIGVMNFRSGKLKAYTEKDLRLAERVGMQVAGAIANAQLYADLRQEEKARQENEQRFREIIENTQAGYFFIDREGLFQQVNGAWLRMHGFGSASEVIGRHFSLTQPETEMKVAERIVANLLAGEAISSAEAARLRRDGAVGYHTFSAHPVIREGRIVGCEGFIIDISTQRRLEEDYRTLFREMLDGFALHEIICDPQGNPADYRFLAVNPAFERLTGLRATDLVGRTVLEAFPGTERRWIETYGRVALTGEPVLFDNYHAGLKKHFDVAAFRPAPGQFACIFTDITERKRAEEERTRLQEQLLQSQKMESVGRLAGGVAHDFNNMLGVILGHADMAMEQLDPLAPLYGDLREIRKAAERSSELTRQLLAFARKQTVSLRVLDLNETLAGMLRMLQRLIGEDIQLVLQPGEGLWRVRMDPSQVDQILANLSVNARDAISGVGKVAIETGNVTLKEGNRAELPGVVPGDYVLLAVSDDGCGMSREILDKLFEPFFTTKAAGKGTGLGLATVYGIVKQNDGFIQVRSAPGEGTTFRIYLPRYVDSGGQGSGERVAEPVVRGHETVLVVEDERALLDLSRRMLEKLGYRVLAAGSPGEAMELAEQHSGEIHLLMTDVVMPDMNGRDLARNLLSLYPNLKRLFMSGYTADVIARHGVLDEGVHFIQKPFSKQELAARVRAALDRD